MIEGAALWVRLLLGLGAMQAVGYGVLAWISPQARGLTALERHALSFGLGPLIISLWMLTLSLIGFSFHLPVVAAPPLALALFGLLRQRSRLPDQAPPLPEAETTETRQPKTENRLTRLFLGLLALLLLFAALRAVLYPMWAWDALATWGFKAQVFYLEGGLDFGRIQAHNYYPNLTPLLLTYLYLCLGQVNDHLVKLVFPLFGAALLGLLYSLLWRMGLARPLSLGVTAFFALNGATFIVHLYIAYADLALAYYTLGAVGFTYLRLKGAASPGSLPLIAGFTAAMAWCKFEGAPLAATIVLAAALTLLWLKPPALPRRLAALAWPAAGILLGYLPWRLFMQLNHIETGRDHIRGFYAHQLWQAVPALLQALVHPKFFGLLWPAALLSLAWMLKEPRPSSELLGRGEAGQGLFRTIPLLSSPALFLALFLGGNLLAILLGYAVAPTSPAEFPLYVRATLDRLLLHIAPVAALLVGEGLEKFAERAKVDPPSP
jgi:hypothetical protein